MEGDLLGVGPPTDNTTDEPIRNPSDEPSLLDFDASVPSQDVTSNVDLMQQKQQPSQPQSQPEPQQQQQVSPNLLDLGATPPPLQEPQNQHQQAPLVDLFGGPQLLPMSPSAEAVAAAAPNNNNSTTPQPSQTAAQQPLDLFGAPIPPSAPPLPIEIAPSIPVSIPAAISTPMATAAADSFAVFQQPQVPSQAAAVPDPFSTFSGSLPASTLPEKQPQPIETIAPVAAIATAPAATTPPSVGLPVTAQTETGTTSSTSKLSTEATTEATESLTTPINNDTTIDKSGEEEKKEQESPIVPVESAKEVEAVVAAETIGSSSTDSGGIEEKSSATSPPKSDAATVVTEKEKISGENKSNNTNTNNIITTTTSVPSVEDSLVSPDKKVAAVEEIEREGSVPIPNDENKDSSQGNMEKEPMVPLVSLPTSTVAAIPETSKPGNQESASDVPIIVGTSEDKAEANANATNQAEKLSEEASSTSTSAAPASEQVVTTKDAGAIPLDSKAASGTKTENGKPKPEGGEKAQTTVESVPSSPATTQRKQSTKSTFLSTLTKSPVKNRPLVGNRFAGFKSMAGTIAAKGAERVAKVKDQIQKEEDAQTANSTAAATVNANANRFAGFKSMAGTIAAKGAERVAKVKDQIQKEEDAQTTNSTGTATANRFAGFKSMAGNIAAKGAERVVKVKEQIQKDEENARRFSGLKNMAGNMAAKGVKTVASVQVDTSAFSTTAKLPLFGKGSRTETSKPASTAPPSLTATGAKAAPEPSPQTASETTNGTSGPPKPTAPSVTVAGTNAKPPNTPSKSPSTPAAGTSDIPHVPEGSTLTPKKEVPPPKQQVATDAKTSEISKSSGETATKASKSSPLPSQVEPISIKVEETKSIEPDATVDDAADSNKSTNSVPTESSPGAQKSPKLDTPAPDAAKSPATGTRVDAAESGEKSKSVPPPGPTVAVNDVSKEAQNSATSFAQDSSAKFKPESSEGPSADEKTKAISSKPNNNSNAPLTTNPTSPKDVTKSSLSESTAAKPTTETKSHAVTNPVETSNRPQPQQPPVSSIEVEVLQKELRAAHTLIMQLQHHENVEEERPEDVVMVELQANLEKEMTRRAEAEAKCRVALQASKRIKEEYSTFKALSKTNLEVMTTSVESLTQEKDAKEKELVDIREERDEQARKEMALTTRLNAAKKKEAIKANTAEHYEDQVDHLESTVKEYESQVESLTTERDQLKVELGEWKVYAEKRTKQLETALSDEKKLNDDRKRKMKGFVEAKTEEVRSAKVDFLSLQTELDQTSHSLRELNQRYKQLHAQWVQSQTRNRELQRDAMKMQKDSEKMHKVGGSLEARLSRSAQQSEDHKNKRIHARNELMSVLGQLEAERGVNVRLQESIKMTFTPKALSQQQTIQEALDDFEGALQKLSTRIGRPLPPSFSGGPNAYGDNQSLDGDSVELNAVTNGDTAAADDDSNQGTANLSEINSNKAVQKLENETQRVSQSIMKFSASIERMHGVLDGGGTRNCVDALSQMLMMSGNTPAIAANPTRRSTGSQRYGQISGNMP